MKKMKINLIGISIAVIGFTSCDNKVVSEFEVENNTEYKIDSLKIEPNDSDENKYITINTSEKAEYKADMTTAKADGAYKISYKVNGTKKTQVFGYYSNGIPSEGITKIKIEKDTVLIDQIFGG